MGLPEAAFGCEIRPASFEFKRAFCRPAFLVVLLAGLAGIPWGESIAGEQNQTTTSQVAPPANGHALTQVDALITKAQTNGEVPLIVRLNVDFRVEGTRPAPAVAFQRKAISDAQDSVVHALAGMHAANIKRYRYVPYLAVTVNAAALQALAQNPGVAGISEDVALPPVLAESTGVVGANGAWNLGYDGTGWAVAVLDTGVDKYHNFLAGKVISEACYSTTNTNPFSRSTSLCPGGASSSTAVDSGVNCDTSIPGCDHGTHVAGIAAGRDYAPNGPGYNGVARGASIIAIKVFSKFQGFNCGSGGSSCVLAWTSDIIRGLERVYELSSTFNIAAANLSLGGGQYTSTCDGESEKPSIDNLRAVNIATVIASGNDAYTTAIGSPACISTAISVGATCDSAGVGYGCTAVDDVPGYSNIASFISLLAPGSLISSSTPGTNTFQSWHGTSMATPHVTGAWAVMKQADPSATVSTVLTALRSTGTRVDDQRSSGTVTGMRRINVDLAVQSLLPQLPAPSFTYPLGGEALLAGSTTNITWNTNEPLTFGDTMESGAGNWSVSHGAGAYDWSLVTANPHAGSHAWFAGDPDGAGDQYLKSACSVAVPEQGKLSFWHSDNSQQGFDGGVVEISTDGVNWTDLGPFMTKGGYTGTISSCCGSPLAGRPAFTGNSGGYVETVIDLNSYAGQAAYIRFRMASDSTVSGVGWYVDDVKLFGSNAVYELAVTDHCGGAATWTTIGTTTSAASSLRWSVPSTAGNDYCLRIQARAPGYQDSPVVTGAAFTVEADSDGDGLSDDYEVNVLGTNPFSIDSDGDGLVDGRGGVVSLASFPGGIDANGDGFADGEQDFGTSPIDSDSDGDRLSDGEEIGSYGTDPTVSNLGDVAPRGSPDNALDTGDLVVLTRLATGAIAPTELESMLGDINADGQINAADVLLLQRSILLGAPP